MPFVLDSHSSFLAIVRLAEQCGVLQLQLGEVGAQRQATCHGSSKREIKKLGHSSAGTAARSPESRRRPLELSRRTRSAAAAELCDQSTRQRGYRNGPARREAWPDIGSQRVRARSVSRSALILLSRLHVARQAAAEPGLLMRRHGTRAAQHSVTIARSTVRARRFEHA